MRRGLAFASLFLLLAGLELSTEAISLVLSRLQAGMGALVAGAEFHVSAPRFTLGVTGIVLGLTIWMLLIWSARRRHDVGAAGTACPQCGNRTRRVKRSGWQRVLAVVLGEHLTRRRCETCGWTGLSVRA